ncbi:hypothetical protein ACQPW1_15070 [Nocardia sp. CA-128927]|uniref:hypothetical protein n=1 Tax=Nocardia sp. CA-128927 TaxID=3239975 RepID=UPI003D981B1B
MRISRSVNAGLVAVAAAAGTMLTAPLVHAAPPGKVNCVPVPVDSRLEATCTNTDVGAGTAVSLTVCSDLRTVYEPAHRMAGNTTETFTQDCGPGAHPMSWNVKGETDYERARRIEREGK